MAETKEKRYKWRREDYRENTKGLLMVNTGDGKGKTTAALGVLVRAAGRGMKCCLIQFMKSKSDRYGEHESLEKLGVETLGGSPEKLAGMVESEIRKWTDIARERNIRIEP